MKKTKNNYLTMITNNFINGISNAYEKIKTGAVYFYHRLRVCYKVLRYRYYLCGGIPGNKSIDGAWTDVHMPNDKTGYHYLNSIKLMIDQSLIPQIDFQVDCEGYGTEVNEKRDDYHSLIRNICEMTRNQATLLAMTCIVNDPMSESLTDSILKSVMRCMDDIITVTDNPTGPWTLENMYKTLETGIPDDEDDKEKVKAFTTKISKTSFKIDH